MTILSDTLHLIYHNVPATDIPYKYAVSSNLLREHLMIVQEQRPSAGLKAAITFDDGHRTQFENAFPVLTATGVLATFFVTAAWTDVKMNFMTTAQLRELSAAGHTIGAHGLTHKWLTQCSPSELKRELGEAKQKLEQAVGVPITALSIPGGRYDKRILLACREEGYDSVFTSEPVVNVRRQSGLTIIGRYNVRNTMSCERLRSLLEPESNVFRNEQRLAQLKGWAKIVLGDHLYHRVWSVLTRENAEP